MQVEEETTSGLPIPTRDSEPPRQEPGETEVVEEEKEEENKETGTRTRTRTLVHYYRIDRAQMAHLESGIDSLLAVTIFSDM